MLIPDLANLMSRCLLWDLTRFLLGSSETPTVCLSACWPGSDVVLVKFTFLLRWSESCDLWSRERWGKHILLNAISLNLETIKSWCSRGHVISIWMPPLLIFCLLGNSVNFFNKLEIKKMMLVWFHSFRLSLPVLRFLSRCFTFSWRNVGRMLELKCYCNKTDSSAK